MVDTDVLSLLEQVWVVSLGLNQGTRPSYRAQHPTSSGEIKIPVKIECLGFVFPDWCCSGCGILHRSEIACGD